MINRREFLTGVAAGGLLTSMPAISPGASRDASTSARFQLNYAPHFGMFRHSGGDDLLDQLRFAADEGFTAFEDNALKSRPVEFQRRMRQELDRRGMQMGLFVGSANFGEPTFASHQVDSRERVLSEMRSAAETASRMNARWCSVVMGKVDSRLSWSEQTANALDVLKRCAEICERANLVMLLEPMAHDERSPRLFLQSLPQAFALCRMVNSPSCKILSDAYEQHAAYGDVCEQVCRFGSEIGYFQFADNPGRKEPGTGDIDFQSLVRLLREQQYQGIVGMDHGNLFASRRGERAVIDAYRLLDRA